MARNRTPLAKAEVTGAAMKHPERYGDRKNPSGTGPLGEPYARLTKEQAGYWREFKLTLPWLNSSHRQMLRLACVLSARVDEPEVSVPTLQALSAILSKLGASPCDATKVSWEPPAEEDPTAKYFRH